MSALEQAAAPPVPEPEFGVVGAAPVTHSAAPRIVFTLRASEPGEREIYTIALTAQIVVDPDRRAYDEETRRRLVELFGQPERWHATTEQSILFAQVDVLVPSFVRETTFEASVPVTFDLDVAAAKYVAALRDGHVPLTFAFTGSVFYRGDDGRLQVVRVPWSCSARFRLPVATWREAVEARYGTGGGVIRLGTETLDRLQRARAARGLPSLDAVVASLLDEVGR